jgi:hypothetical protein
MQVEVSEVEADAKQPVPALHEAGSVQGWPTSADPDARQPNLDTVSAQMMSQVVVPAQV